MFHTARTILWNDGFREKSHACIGRYLETVYVKKKLLEQRWVDLLDYYRNIRHDDSYSTSCHFPYSLDRHSPEAAVLILDQEHRHLGEHMVHCIRVKKFIPERLMKHDFGVPCCNSAGNIEPPERKRLERKIPARPAVEPCKPDERFGMLGELFYHLSGLKMPAGKKFVNGTQSPSGNNVIIRGILGLMRMQEKMLEGKLLFANKREAGMSALGRISAVFTSSIRDKDGLAQSRAGADHGYGGVPVRKAGEDYPGGIACRRYTGKRLRDKVIDQEAALKSIIALGVGNVDFPGN